MSAKRGSIPCGVALNGLMGIPRLARFCRDDGLGQSVELANCSVVVDGAGWLFYLWQRAKRGDNMVDLLGGQYDALAQVMPQECLFFGRAYWCVCRATHLCYRRMWLLDTRRQRCL